MPRVAVIFTGGTISMRAADSGGNAPTLAGEQLLATVPELSQVADLEIVDWGMKPGSHLTFDDVLDIGRTVDGQLRKEHIDGAVVVQGTDNIEETAFAWDLLPLPTKPLVVTGAMRSASQRGYDGPDNLLGAVVAAASPALAATGVVVALAGELHAADAVRKLHTHAHETFKSPGAGRLGVVADGAVHVERSREPFRLPHFPDGVGRIHILTAVLGGDELATAPLLDRPPDGLVIEAFGGGNTQAELLDLAVQLMERGVTVAHTTRALSGAVRPGYGFPGGSSTWWEAGAIFAGSLGALKSRVALAMATGAGLAREQTVELFAAFGGGAR